MPSFMAFVDKAYAQDRSKIDFEINTTYTIDYNPPNDFVRINEDIHLKVNNRSYYFPAKEERVFVLPDFSLQDSTDERTFKIRSIRVTDKNDQPVNHEIRNGDDGIEIVIPDTKDITYWSDERIKISYETHELLNKNGNVTNLYIPGLPEDTQFTKIDTTSEGDTLVTQYSFKTTLEVPENSPEESFLYPQGKIQRSDGFGKRVYTIEAVDRIGETAWIQLGTKQYYYFKMVQPTPKTDNIIPEQISQFSDLISTNIYQLPLPKEDSETSQKVFFTNISPSPTRVELDREGNYLATFEVPANKDGEIVVEGYITMESTYDTSSITDKPINEYQTTIMADPNLTRYTQSDEFWESNSDVVFQYASDLQDQSNSILDLIENDYNFIIDKFDYSYSKVAGVNERLGALAALEGAEAVCMEYSDALIAIFRAQGVPARAAIGYGNDPTGAENEIGTEEAVAQNIGHQWLQVWIPDYGWLSVDPTWGESGRRYIGPNLDHILWYTVGDSEQGYVGTSLSTADPVSQHVLTSYDVFLRALPQSEFDQINGSLTPLSEIAIEYEGTEDDQISSFLKTTSIGKVIVIAVPLLLLLFGIFIVTSLISAVIKGYKINRANRNESNRF